MKLRILGNSIRLRLTRSEVASAAEGAVVEARCVLGPSATDALVYSLVPDVELTEVDVRWTPGVLEVRAPLALVRQWNDTERVGMERTWRQAEGAELRVLVEKDFSCLKPRDDGDDLDTFPNPQAE